MNTIVIPRNSLIILCGTAGSGKSTWAARHFSSTQIVSSDQCRALVSDDPANQEASPEAFHLMHFIIEKRLALHRLTVADATSLNAQDRKAFLRIARRFHFNVVLVVFDIPIEICLLRNARRDRVVPRQAVESQYALLEAALPRIDSEGFDSVYVLDEKTQSAVAVKITRAISRRSQPLSR